MRVRGNSGSAVELFERDWVRGKWLTSLSADTLSLQSDKACVRWVNGMDHKREDQRDVSESRIKDCLTDSGTSIPARSTARNK